MLAAILLAAATSVAFGDIVPGPVIGGLTTFIDTTTGFDWLTLNDTYNLDYSDQLAALPAGFHVADFNEVNALATNSMPNPGDDPSWQYYNSVVMGSTSRGLIWGNYADPGGPGPNAWFYSYQDGDWAYYNPGSTSGFSDLGLWAVNGSPAVVPEPGTAALLMGAGALVWIRRRNWAA
jgi:hypothetical protein